MISNSKTTQKFLNSTLNPCDFFYVVTFPKDALAIENIFPYNIVCFDNHPIVDLISATKINIFSLDRMAKDYPKRRSTSVLLKHPQTVKWINSISQNPHIIVFKPSPSLEAICRQNNWKLIANPAKLNRQIENKINFTKIIDKLSLPQPKYIIKKLNEINFNTIFKELGNGFFLQFPRGFAGSSTFQIKSEKELSQIQSEYLNYPTKFSAKIDGPTYTLNACVTKNHQTIIQKPFFQITNILKLNPSPGGTCGNIYSHQSCLPENKYLKPWEQNLSKIESRSFLNSPDNFNQINLSIINDAKIFGNYLSSLGYQGIFGLDFVIDQNTGKYYFIECNPRLTASIPMISKLQTKNNEIPLLAIHLLELAHQSYSLSENAITKISLNPNIGSQIIFRNTTSNPITPPIILETGIYTLNQIPKNIYELQEIVSQHPSNLVFLRPGKDILDIKNKQEFLILAEPSDKLISPNIEYLRIQSLV